MGNKKILFIFTFIILVIFYKLHFHIEFIENFIYQLEFHPFLFLDIFITLSYELSISHKIY